MKIKSIRKPTEKEKKEIIPKLMIFGSVALILTAFYYLTLFATKSLGESLYLAQNFWTRKSVAEHNLCIKLFELIYRRDYMTNKLEGLPISALLAVISETVVLAIYKGYTFINKGKNK